MKRQTWLAPLYFGETAEKKKDRLIRKLNRSKGMPADVYLITLAANGRDVFDMLSAVWLMQPAVKKRLPTVVGIACGREEAMEVVLGIAREVYEKTGGADIRRYILERYQKEGL